MPRTSSLIEVTIKDHGIEHGTRTISIRLRARPTLFETSDLLAAERVIPRLDQLLRRANREAIASYIHHGKNFAKEACKRRRRK